MQNKAGNLRILKKTRRKPAPGDIFVFQLESIKERFFFGRVIATDSTLGNAENVVLFYIYRVYSHSKTLIPVLLPTELLLPPMGTNNLPWTRGYFEVVRSEQLETKDLLKLHCFYSAARKRYYDEYGHSLPAPVEPVGSYGVHGLGAIDNEISKALGVPPVAV